MRVYPDTNAATYFFDRPGWSPTLLRAIRRSLRRSCHSRRISVVTSSFIIEELTGVVNFDRKLYRRIIWFLLGLAERRVLLPTNERVKIEAAVRGLAPRAARYLSAPDRERMRKGILKLSVARRVAVGVAELIAPVKADLEARREHIRQQMGAGWSAQTRNWWTQAEPQIDDWTNDYIRISKEFLGLPDDQLQWPTPEQMPTARLRHAYYMARIALNVAENRRIEPSDYYDAAHYSEGGYFDLMITDDRRLLDTYASIPPSHRPFAVETFREFAAKRLGIYGLPT